jgi:RND family efflux transporter MFP subunit
MKRMSLIVLTAFLAACSSDTQAPAGDAAEPERPAVSVTRWTDKTELFLEYPVLAQDEDSRFAIHLTRLGDFQAVAEGRCQVTLGYADGESQVFSTDSPSSPGIFGVTVTPNRAGAARIEIRLGSAAVSDVHTLENVMVYASLEAAPSDQEAPEEETISFLKEQQWALDFATALVATGTIRESLRVSAEVGPRSGGEVEVTAPFGGRLVSDNLPVIGTPVRQGEVLASIVLPTSAPSDRAALDLAKAEAQASLEYARRDGERAARLVEAGAAPAKRLDEARTSQSLAEARLRASEERIRQFESSREAEGSAGSAAFAIRAPIGGTIVETFASPGANLESGERLFRIVDTERVYVSAIVPEAEFPRLRNLTGAEIEIPGSPRPRPAGRLISVGKVVDPASRTFAVVYEFANPDGLIAINQTVSIRLFLSGNREGALVPESALVDDGGRPVVFAQITGESFARRPVTLGSRQGGLVEVVSGVEPGERVVTRGAYLIRLAAMSTQIPAHGHVH